VDNDLDIYLLFATLVTTADVHKHYGQTRVAKRESLKKGFFCFTVEMWTRARSVYM